MKKHLYKISLGAFAFMLLLPLMYQAYWWNMRFCYKVGIILQSLQQ